MQVQELKQSDKEIQGEIDLQQKELDNAQHDFEGAEREVQL